MSRLPSPDRIKDDDTKAYLRELVQSIERQHSKFAMKPFTKDRIKVTNVSAQYVLDNTSVGLVDVAKVLGTFLLQLQESGVMP